MCVCLCGGKNLAWNEGLVFVRFICEQKRKHESKDLVRVGLNLDCLQMYCWDFPGADNDIPGEFLTRSIFCQFDCEFKPMPLARQ